MSSRPRGQLEKILECLLSSPSEVLHDFDDVIHSHHYFHTAGIRLLETGDNLLHEGPDQDDDQ